MVDRVPPAVSLMVLGVLVGPAVLDLLPEAWLGHRTTLSAAAFVVLLLRAGLGMPPRALRVIAIPAILFGVVPAMAELGAVALLSRALLFDGWLLAALAGFLVAAVSPAVVLPTMLAQKDARRGGPRFVPDLIMGQTVVNAAIATAGIRLVLEALAPVPGGPGARAVLLALPVAVVVGGFLGAGIGTIFRIERLTGSGEDPRRVCLTAAVLVSVGFVLYFGCRPVSWLDSVVATLMLGLALRRRLGRRERVLSDALRSVWGVAEIVLFVNLGSAIQLDALMDARVVLLALPVLAAALGVRLLVAHVMTRPTALLPGERRYVTLAHIPKATIQAVFGPLPYLTFVVLRPDLVADGQTLLLMAALAIVATAPVGAVALDRWGRRCLVENAEPRAA
jgi:Kef-type K+ transport system membrane component KefB